MADKTTLFFDGLPTFESTPLFFSLSDETDRRLKTLPATYARCNAALRFTSWIGAGTDFLHVREDELASMRVACLRAALMEFAGMEEALPSDIGPAPTRMALRIRDTGNAMLVILRELRNVQIHLVRTEFETGTRSAVMRSDGKEHWSELTALMIPRTDLERLADPRNTRQFHMPDLRRAIDWLLDAQAHWGISDVLMRGIWAYADAIVEAHVPAVSSPVIPPSSK